MNRELILSICIPTNDRIEILRNTLDSIYINCKVNIQEFEVVISDNSNNNELHEMLKGYSHYKNIKYEKTHCKGFLNSINALKMASGKLLKLHNNYTMFEENALQQLIHFIKNHTNSLIFFTNTGKNCAYYFDSFDNFNNRLTYWNSWSTGFSIWKIDFDKISNIEVDHMFPHLTLFLNQSFKNSFIINDYKYFINQDVPNKGGYNLFETFSIVYLNLIKDAFEKDILSKVTYLKIKKTLLENFLSEWYFNTKLIKNSYTFQINNIKKNISYNYGITGYYKLVLYSYILLLKKVFNNKILKKLK